MNTLAVAKGVTLVDVHYLGQDRYIAPCLLEDESGVAVVDPGPTSSLAGLEAGLAERGLTTANIHTLLLTHIHLDHAGAAGTLVKRHPHIRVYVHEKGARHMIDPAKLLASAQRLYGDHMGYLWGEFLAVPADNVTVLTGGETITVGTIGTVGTVGGRKLEVVYTPGHAVHHVSYFDQTEGIGFTGDTTGMRPMDVPCAFPVTPPPDINLEAWRGSLAAIRERRPQSLFITHFGPSTNPEWHLAEMGERLEKWAEQVSADVKSGRPDVESAADFAKTQQTSLTANIPADDFGPMIRTEALVASWFGLARYCRK
jgi:glyoxylase-like metal-dependent hydrolase (beta-lactamase superfamily II)